MKKNTKKWIAQIIIIGLIISICGKKNIYAINEQENQIEEADKSIEAYFNGEFDPFVYVIDPAPISSISKGDLIVNFTYDENGNRLTKQVNDEITSFSYSADNRMEMCSNSKTSIVFLYEYTGEENKLVGFIYLGECFYYQYSKDGNIEFILDNRKNIVCKYVYLDNMETMVFEANGDIFQENTEANFIGNINPIRFGGYFYDAEINCYYLNKGIYYDTDENMYIMNDYYFDEEQYEKDYTTYMSQKNGGIELCTSIQNPLFSRVATMYATLLNLDATHESVSNVSEAQWMSGARWYDGRGTAEIIARCIYGENGYKARSADRTAIAYVIANQTNSASFPNTAYKVVINQGRFYAVNPDYNKKESSFAEAVGNNTAAARSAKVKTDEVWQQCLRLACLLTLSTTISEMEKLEKIPDGINVQKCFISLSTAHVENNITYSGGYFYIKGIKVTHVAIAGVGEIPATATGYNQLKEYAKIIQKYNLYYTFYDESLL